MAKNIYTIFILIIILFSCSKNETYKLSGDICNVCSQSLTHIIGKDTVGIPTVFTPNGDGYDEYFYIFRLDKYPNNSLIIYDRNKNQIVKFSPYNNDWNGHYNNKVYGNGLYYYQLTLDSVEIESSLLLLATKDDYYNIKISENTCGMNCVHTDPKDPFLQ